MSEADGASRSALATTRRRGSAAAVCAALVLSVAVLYAPVRSFDFIDCDDDRYVFENPVVEQGLHWTGVVWAFTTFQVANWHPLSWLSHMADVSLFGVSAGAHHLVNVGFHAVDAVLLFLALCSLSGRLWPPALVAAWFALHPQRVESVAWVAERKELLSGLCFGATLLAYAAYARRPGVARLLGVTAWLGLGLLAKPMLVTVPFLLLLLDLWPLGRWRRLATAGGGAPLHRLVLEKLPLFALAAAASAVALLSQTAGGAMGNLQALPFAARLSNALASVAAYLGQAVWPSGLAVFYPHPAFVQPEQYTPWNGHAAAAGLLVLALSALAVQQLRRRPYLLVGWLWTLGMLVPVIGLVQVGDQARADRYAYLPLIGVGVAAAWALADLVERRPSLREPAAVGAAALLVAYATVSGRQIAYWRDTGTLFEHALAVTRGNYFAHNHLGRYLEDRGELERAAAEYRAALRLHPGYASAHSNLGNTLAKLGEPDAAVEQFEQALRLQPAFAEAYSNLGVAQAQRGRPALALAAYQRAVELAPELFAAQLNLGRALLRQGQVPQALQHLERAVALDPGHADAANDLGVARAAYGDLAGAAAAYRRALALDPDHASARCNLGMALEKAGDGAAADRYAEALERGADCAPARRYLGARAMANGDLDLAARHFDAWVRLRPEDADAHNDAGVAAVRRGEVDRARSAFEAALRLAPAHERARRNLAALEREAAAAGESGAPAPAGE